MTARQLEKWSKTRKLGQMKYIAIYGVLLWGMLTGLIWVLIMQFIDPSGAAMRYVIAAFVFPLCGIAFGKITWEISEKKYQAYRDQDADQL